MTYCTIRTHNERKQILGHPKELIRGKRSKAGLPTSWDDIFRQHQRNWKKHRKTAWRPKPKPKGGYE